MSLSRSLCLGLCLGLSLPLSVSLFPPASLSHSLSLSLVDPRTISVSTAHSFKGLDQCQDVSVGMLKSVNDRFGVPTKR